MKKIQDYYGELPFELKPSQKEFLEEFTTSEGHFCLLGEAGSGKSTIMGVLKKFYGNAMVCCASTGVANTSLFNGEGGDGTAHKVFSIPIGIPTKEELRKVNSVTQGLFSPSDVVKIVVIDEFAMLNPANLYVILHRIKRFNRASAKRGERNIRLLLVGDILQLPAITSDIDEELVELYGSRYIFDCNPWKDNNFTTMKLREVNRQEDKVFIEALNVLRYGKMDRVPKLLSWLNKRYDPSYDRTALLIASTNKKVDEANTRALYAKGKPIGKYTATIRGKINIKDVPVDEEVSLCEDMEVITLTNHPEGLWNNGSSGRVVSMESGGCYVEFDSDGRVEFVGLHTFTETEPYVEVGVVQEDGSVIDVVKKKEVGWLTQVPLKAFAAMSVHRSQGRTIKKKGVIDVGSTWTYRNRGDFGTHLLYVALSRFSDINLVTFATKLQPEHVKVDRKTVDWWESI